MTIWHEIEVKAVGTLTRRERSVAEIDPEAVAYFADLIRRHSGGWREPLEGFGHLVLDVSIHQDSGVTLTIWLDGGGVAPLVIAAYLTGAEPDVERDLLFMVQRTLILSLHRDADVEPGYDLIAETARPLVAAFIFPRPGARPEDYMVIGEAESCLAAALFGGLE